MPAGKRWWLSPAAAYSGLAGNTSVTCLACRGRQPTSVPCRQKDKGNSQDVTAAHWSTSGLRLWAWQLPPAMDSCCHHELYPPWTGP